MTTQTVRPIYSILLVIADSIAIFLAFAGAYYLRQTIGWPHPLQNSIPFSTYTGLIGVQIISLVLVLSLRRQYNIPRAVSRIDQIYAVIQSVTIGILLALGLFTLMFKNTDWEVDFPRAMIAYNWILTVVLLMGVRFVYQRVREWAQARGWGQDRLLLVGSNDVARIILQRILWSPQLGYRVVGVVTADSHLEEMLDVPVLGAPEMLPQLIEEYQIDEVIIAMPEQGHRAAMEVISYCERGRVSIKVFPDVFQFVASQTTVDDLGGLPLLAVRDFAMRGYALILKRLMDIAGAAFGLIFLSPLFMFVAAAVKFESPGPVFFVQERMGLDGKPFKMIKFRSMRTDAEKHGPGWTIDDDPRQTRLGRFLRRVDVDELPQLVNVLIGEMSLVGPRPEQPYYVEQFRETVPRYMERHREKAGMTGWAQVNGLRGDTSIVERTKYDIWYTENWSIWLDIKIILRTVWQAVGALWRRARS
ncbi:MAG TPA: undecaprenyl-phosphate glucose phosphotransferase [Anaerolineae bacterium]|nr:undecaprenyl-phosphate glucose phosphotransferase [Anaerolineae bacterium]